MSQGSRDLFALIWASAGVVSRVVVTMLLKVEIAGRNKVSELILSTTRRECSVSFLSVRSGALSRKPLACSRHCSLAYSLAASTT